MKTRRWVQLIWKYQTAVTQKEALLTLQGVPRAAIAALQEELDSQQTMLAIEIAELKAQSNSDVVESMVFSQKSNKRGLITRLILEMSHERSSTVGLTYFAMLPNG